MLAVELAKVLEEKDREGIFVLMKRRERGEGWSPELEQKFQEIMRERQQKGLSPFEPK